MVLRNPQELPEISFIVKYNSPCRLTHDVIDNYFSDNMPSSRIRHGYESFIDTRGDFFTYGFHISRRKGILPASSAAVEVAQLNDYNVYVRIISNESQGLSKLREPLLEVFGKRQEVFSLDKDGKYLIGEVNTQHRQSLTGILVNLGIASKEFSV